MEKIETIISAIDIGLRDELRIRKLDDIDDGIWYSVEIYKNGVLERGFQDTSLLKALEQMYIYKEL